VAPGRRDVRRDVRRNIYRDMKPTMQRPANETSAAALQPHSAALLNDGRPQWQQLALARSH